MWHYGRTGRQHCNNHDSDDNVMCESLFLFHIQAYIISHDQLHSSPEMEISKGKTMGHHTYFNIYIHTSLHHLQLPVSLRTVSYLLLSFQDARRKTVESNKGSRKVAKVAECFGNDGAYMLGTWSSWY